MVKILTVVGARPQFVKAAIVSHVLRAETSIQELLLHTGQHYDQDMSDVFFEELGIPRPDFQLAIGSGPHGKQTGRMLEAIEQVLLDETPDRVLVYGDTNSTIAGALAAAKLHLPIVHVEAGLRSFNRRMPEEINRILCDQLSDLLFAPTVTAVRNLCNEGIASERIQLVGDVMYDATLHYLERAQRSSRILDQLGLAASSYTLATMHRAENVDDASRLDEILQALKRWSQTCPVIVPLHPRTRSAIEKFELSSRAGGKVRFIDPLGYLDMLQLEKHAQLIVTDSGGIQKEAFFVQVPCLTLREETEWTELVELGWNRLVKRSELGCLETIAGQWILDARQCPQDDDLYGGGRAAERILQRLVEAGEDASRKAA